MFDQDKKNINLMPEDLRSKESGILHKKKGSWEPDLISPQAKDLAYMSGKGQSSGVSFLASLKLFWQKLFSTNRHKKERGDDQNKDLQQVFTDKKSINVQDDKISKSKLVFIPEKKDHQVPVDGLHIPKSEKTSELGIKQDFSLPNNINDKSKSGLSWWREFLNLFKRGKKSKKSSQEIPKLENKIVNQVILKSDDIVKLENKKINELKSTPTIIAPMINDDKSTETEPAEKKEKKEDFHLSTVIPATVSETEDKEELPNQFHQPKPLIRAKFISEGGGVDLIPQSARTRSWKQIFNLCLISLIGSVVIVAIFFVFLFIHGKNKENQQVNKIQQISDLEETILSYSDLNNEIKFLGEDIKLAYGVLNLHIYWTNFFTLLEKYTVDDVYYNSFSAGDSGAITLSAVAKDYDTVAKQLKVLQTPAALEFAQSVDISAADKNDSESGGVNFSINLVLNPELFYYDNSLE